MRSLLLALSVPLLVLPACRSHKETTSTIVQRDSVVVRYVPRDTLVWSVRDSVTVRAEVPPPGRDLAPVTNSKGSAKATLRITNGVAHADCVCDSTAIKVRLWDKFTREASLREERNKVVETVVKTHIPAWVWWSLAVNILFVAYHVVRFYIRFQTNWRKHPLS